MGWFSKLFSRTKELVDKDAARLVYVRIPAERVSPGHADTPISANSHYLRVWLTEMFLAKETEWFKSYAPIVHSVVRLRFGASSTPEVELPHVAGEMHLDGVEAGSLDKVIHLDHALTGLLPFRGGTVELAAGLIRARQRDLLAGMVDVLGNLSSLTTVPQLSAVMSVIKPLAEGLGTFLGDTEDKLWLGISDTFVGAGGEATDNMLRPGYIAAINADVNQFDTSQLCVRERRLCMGPDVATAPEFVGHDFMLFRVESRTNREKDEWELLESIGAPWKDVLRHLMSRNFDDALESLGATIYAVQTSVDLTTDDRDAVIRRLKERYRIARAQYDFTGLESDAGKNIDSRAELDIENWSLGHIMTQDPPGQDPPGHA